MSGTVGDMRLGISPGGWWNRLRMVLGEKVSGASLALFRIAVGLVMLLEAVSMFFPSESSGGRRPIEVYYTGREVTFNFPYEGFGWLPLLPAAWIEGVCLVLGLAALSMAVGFCYRISATVTFLAWGYLYAIESTRTYWMSYYYLELLVLFLLLWMPAAERFSVDAWRRKVVVTGLIPFWPVLLLRAQLVVTYFYAGFAKLNGDWLFEGMPVRIFLEKPWVAARLKSLLPVGWSGSVDAVVHSPVMIHFLGWSGAAFDLSVGFLLLFRRTRALGMVLLLLFHGFNHFILFTDIVWFPLLGVTTACIFLQPDWPTRMSRWLRQPRIPRPDWRWLLGGAVIVPVVGAALGWRSVPTARDGAQQSARPLRRWTAPLVVLWIVFQALVPLRHLLIPGDVRITFEGLSWSWRLKTEVYQSAPCIIRVDDRALNAVPGSLPARLDWSQWPEEKVLFRQAKPEDIDWSKLPELVVVLEPMTGDRILYNSLSGSVTNHSEAGARARVSGLWKALYGHEPDSVARTVPANRVLDGYERSMRARGYRFNSRADVFATLDHLNGRGGDGTMLPVLRRIDPFGLSLNHAGPGLFLLIEDKQLFRKPTGPLLRLEPSRWKNGALGVNEDSGIPRGDSPVVVLHAALGDEEATLLPQFYVADSLETPDHPVEVRWNLLRDVGPSKAMHVSTQPFLLRRYARRVADYWDNAHGRRPSVHALTSVSLNHHLPQTIVDPAADLASVETAWFGHNAWIQPLKPGWPEQNRVQ